jgi:hypothetical protein
LTLALDTRATTFCPPSGLVRQIVGLEEGRISGSS